MLLPARVANHEAWADGRMAEDLILGVLRVYGGVQGAIEIREGVASSAGLDNSLFALKVACALPPFWAVFRDYPIFMPELGRELSFVVLSIAPETVRPNEYVISIHGTDYVPIWTVSLGAC